MTENIELMLNSDDKEMRTLAVITILRMGREALKTYFREKGNFTPRWFGATAIIDRQNLVGVEIVPLSGGTGFNCAYFIMSENNIKNEIWKEWHNSKLIEI